MPEIPEAATKETKAGLLAFAEHWFDLVSYAYATGDLQPVKAQTGSECDTCTLVYDAVSSAYEDGGWSSGGEMAIEKLGTDFEKSNIADTGPAYTAAAIVGQGEIIFYDSDGSVKLQEEPDKPVGFTMVLTYGGNGWTTQDANIVGSSEQ